MTRLVLALVFAGCGKSPCERVAPRLMPNPESRFVTRCEARYDDPKFARIVDCLLAVEDGIYDRDLARCDPEGELKVMYFHF